MTVFDVHDARGRWVASFFNCNHAWAYANYALIRRGAVQARFV